MNRIDSIATALGKLGTSNHESTLVRSALFKSLAQDFSALAGTFEEPTGTASVATFDADETTVVSNPPTQAEVQAINDRLLETRQLLKGIIDTLL